MHMSDDQAVLVPAYHEPEGGQGLFADFQPGTRVLPAGFQVQPRFKPLPVGIVLEKDVAVKLRDGVTIYVDVLRPVGDEKGARARRVEPYGKSRGNAPQYVDLLSMLGMDVGALSGLQKFEAPDPAWWCAHGYAVCNPDPRGSYHSEGDIRWWSRFEGQDYHDLIEFLGVQDWCNGKVGTCGNSWRAISQWFAAAEQPPHLAAIAPWEGMSDIYRARLGRAARCARPPPASSPRPGGLGQRPGGWPRPGQRPAYKVRGLRRPDQVWSTGAPVPRRIIGCAAGRGMSRASMRLHGELDGGCVATAGVDNVPAVIVGGDVVASREHAA